MNLNWRAALADIGLASVPGRVSANIAFTKLFSFKAQEFPTTPLLENAGTLARGGLFDWRYDDDAALHDADVERRARVAPPALGEERELRDGPRPRRCRVRAPTTCSA